MHAASSQTSCRPSRSAAEKGKVRPLAALYILERVFHVMTEGALLNPLLGALMGGGAGGGPSLAEFRYNNLEVRSRKLETHL